LCALVHTITVLDKKTVLFAINISFQRLSENI
jgi:hypothetical protein